MYGAVYQIAERTSLHIFQNVHGRHPKTTPGNRASLGNHKTTEIRRNVLSDHNVTSQKSVTKMKGKYIFNYFKAKEQFSNNSREDGDQRG